MRLARSPGSARAWGNAWLDVWNALMGMRHELVGPSARPTERRRRRLCAAARQFLMALRMAPPSQLRTGERLIPEGVVVIGMMEDWQFGRKRRQERIMSRDGAQGTLLHLIRDVEGW